jgi:hypothetical protein
LSRRDDQFEAPGKDSFLDVVANVVAILIILVMVVGSQAQQELVNLHVAEATAGAPAMQPEVAAAEQAAAAVESSIQELQGRIQRQNLEVSLRTSATA